ncbi:MAG TPA: hypothetical protein VHS03_15160 [Gaiellaceae bacterium]|jgi:hypothetical protein|nr:hypothetical protein [Gaiellaceae bacterium]
MLLGGNTVFPITLSAGPPRGNLDPISGQDGWKEVQQAGVNMLRYYPTWTAANAPQQIQAFVQHDLPAAANVGLWLWMGLGPKVANDLTQQALLDQIVNGLKNAPGLGAWKGADEPLWGCLDAGTLGQVHDHIKSLDPNHPVVIVQAPKARKGTTPPKGPNGTLTAALLKPYGPAGDIQAVDIYPISFPPGAHSGRANTDLSVVGDVTNLIVQSAPGKEHWTTLQIAYSGILPPNIPIFPTIRDERFMAYQSIVAGARGLVFFGGDLTQVMRPADDAVGWNWAFWHTVLKPLVQELTSTAVGPALLAPDAPNQAKANQGDVQLVTRKAGNFLYVIAVRKSPTANGSVKFSGLPTTISSGQVLFEYDNQQFRTVDVKAGAFTDPFAPHDARVYRFAT